MTAPLKIDCFLIGTPKSATTWLAAELSRHEDICVSSPKEVNELSDHRGTFARLPRHTDWKRYQTAFAKPGLKLDASIHAFADPDAPHKYKKLFPDAKFILCIREPVERAVSHWNMIKNGELLRKYELKYSSFKSAWLDTRIHSESLYGRSMRRWLRNFPLNRFLIIKSEQLKSTPESAMKTVTDFLRVSPWIAKTSAEMHVTSENRNLNVVGRMARKFLKVPWIHKISEAAPGLKRLPVLTFKNKVSACEARHYELCGPQVIPDLKLFSELTKCDVTDWIHKIQAMSENQS